MLRVYSELTQIKIQAYCLPVQVKKFDKLTFVNRQNFDGITSFSTITLKKAKYAHKLGCFKHNGHHVTSASLGQTLVLYANDNKEKRDSTINWLRYIVQTQEDHWQVMFETVSWYTSNFRNMLCIVIYVILKAKTV